MNAPAIAVVQENRARVHALKRINKACEKLTSLDLEALANQAELWAKTVGATDLGNE